MVATLQTHNCHKCKHEGCGDCDPETCLVHFPKGSWVERHPDWKGDLLVAAWMVAIVAAGIALVMGYGS